MEARRPVDGFCNQQKWGKRFFSITNIGELEKIGMLKQQELEDHGEYRFVVFAFSGMYDDVDQKAVNSEKYRYLSKKNDFVRICHISWMIPPICCLNLPVSW